MSKTKVMQRKPGGLLFPHTIPEHPWEVISMDFITHLPKSSNGNDSIFVIVDKLTKYVHCLAVKEKMSSKQTAELFFDRIVTLHGLPSKIVSDRDTRFTSNFWKELTRILGVQQNMSTSFHPQTDGQSERMNRIIEDMLRCYIQRQTEWEKWLPFVEIAINNSQSSTTGQSPYFSNYGFHPQFKGVRLIEERVSNVPTAVQFVNEIQKNLEHIKTHMRAAIDRQKAYADQKRRELIFQEGDLVKLNTRNLPIIIGVRKLTDRFIGPFKVERKITLINIILLYMCKLYKRDPCSSCQGKNETKYLKQHYVFVCLIDICSNVSRISYWHFTVFGFSSFLPFHFFTF